MSQGMDDPEVTRKAAQDDADRLGEVMLVVKGSLFTFWCPESEDNPLLPSEGTVLFRLIPQPIQDTTQREEPSVPPPSPILDEILTERQAQVGQGYDAAHDDKMHLDGWLCTLCYHLGLAGGNAGEPAAESRFRRQMVILAALAVAAVESLDRTTGKPAPKQGEGSGF